MRHALSHAAALCAAALAMQACDNTDVRRQSSPTQPTGLIVEVRTPPPPLQSFIRDVEPTAIALGQDVEDKISLTDPPCTIAHNRFLISCRNFLVTAPAAGTLVVTVTWDPNATDMILLIRMGDKDLKADAPPWSPLVARMKVAAGQSYRVAVGLAGTGLDGGPFVLTTRMER